MLPRPFNYPPAVLVATPNNDPQPIAEYQTPKSPVFVKGSSTESTQQMTAILMAGQIASLVGRAPRKS